MAIEADVKKYAYGIIGLFVVATIVSALISLLVGTTGLFRASSALDNSTGNAYTVVWVALATIIVIAIVVGLIMMALKMLGGSTHR